MKLLDFIRLEALSARLFEPRLSLSCMRSGKLIKSRLSGFFIVGKDQFDEYVEAYIVFGND